jgi:predicted  nucleic acid-binding Zn-ribbon protein
MTKLKYYVIELPCMPKKMRTLKDDLAAMEGESCSLDGGTCDICGCFFVTDLLQAKRCPNCGSKRWDHKATDARNRLEDVHPWVMEKEKTTKAGTKTYTYWIVSWREGDKVRNVHLGSCRKMDAETARQKARRLKAAALGID